MASNVYTKNEILQELASKGFFIDSCTLDTFFDKWRVEAIFEDEQGSEFYDKNALDLVLNKLFNAEDNEVQEEKKEEVKEQEVRVLPDHVEPKFIEPKQNIVAEPTLDAINNSFNDVEANNILNSIQLTDGTPLINSVQDNINTNSIDYKAIEKNTMQDIEPAIQTPIPDLASSIFKKEKKMGILEGAMLASGKEFEPEVTEAPVSEVKQENQQEEDFDDISLLSESLEAQEKFREYVVSELSKKNVDLTPKPNEFKLDISERTLNMIARSMAKKIAKHVSQICSSDAKTSAQLTEVKEQNNKLETRTRELEDQNKKLRLLLAESNKNLNSYKPSIFGLYRKVSPKK